MYTPSHNRVEDREQILAFMRQYNFATLVTSKEDDILATHLPILIDLNGDAIRLTAHMAIANQQWRSFGEREVMIVFVEPHAFISTRNYERFLSVPTWNYVAVHAYGVPRIIDDSAEKHALIERMWEDFEGNLDHWVELPDEFKQTKLNGIVAFDLLVTRLESRFKLSQDRSDIERQNIVQSLGASPVTTTRTIADLMRDNME